MTLQATSETPPPCEAPPARRSFFRNLTYGLGLVAAAVSGLPVVGYLLRFKQQPIYWVPLGRIADFRPGETRMITFDNPLRQPWDGIVARTGVYVRNQGAAQDEPPQFLVLAVNCAHLGCPVSWFAASGLFMCPCHGGVYYANGERASGPPPRGLFHCLWRVRDDRLEVQAPHYPSLHDTLQTPV